MNNQFERGTVNRLTEKERKAAFRRWTFVAGLGTPSFNFTVFTSVTIITFPFRLNTASLTRLNMFRKTLLCVPRSCMLLR